MDNNEENWKTFLSSIRINTFANLPTNNLTIKTKSRIECLATPFANELLKKNGIDSKNQPETPITKGNISLGDEEKPNTDETLRDIETQAGDCMLFSDCLIVSSRDRDQPEADVNKRSEEKPHSAETGDTTIPVADAIIDRSRERNTLTQTKKKKNDTDISCSMWHISNIAKYFNFKNCVTEIEMPTGISPCVDNIYGMVKKDLRRLSKVVRGIDLEERKLDSYSEFLKQLISITRPESGSRLVLDALLIPLCSALDLQFEVEKSINCSFLPNCRFDYCIRKEEHIIGCIEAKCVTRLSDDSIAQAILQLMILQTTLLRTETPKIIISEFPVFAIVTDGHRFIYIQLKGSSLGFEHEVVKEKGKEIKKLKIREVKQECDFKDILQHISFLVDSSVSKKTYMLDYLFRPFNFVLQMIRNLFLQMVWC